MKKNKKGYTLIEIIIAITLITVIATISIVSITNIKKSSETKRLNNAFKVFDNALDVYLSNHSEIYKNIEDNVEGAVITLEVLKNEGLVSDKIINPITNKVVDYENNYYVLADAVVDEENQDEKKLCNGRVAISVLRSWGELSKNGLDKNSVTYICPRSESQTDDSKIKELEEKIDNLQSALSLSDLGSKNWVIFDVNSDKNKLVSFSADETIQDLWQVVNTSGNEIKLIYNTTADSNNSKNFEELKINEESTTYRYDINIYSSKSSSKKRTTIPKNTKFSIITFNNAGLDIDGEFDQDYSGYKLIKYNNDYYLWNKGRAAYYYSFSESDLYRKLKSSDVYLQYSSNTGWTIQEIFKDTYQTSGSKKEILYNLINSNLKNTIVKKDYYYEYYNDNNDISKVPNYNKTYSDIFGTINPNTDGLNDSEKMKIYLNKNFVVGYYDISISFKDYYGFVELSNGKIRINRTDCDAYKNGYCQETYYYTNSGKQRDSYLYYIKGVNSSKLGYLYEAQPYIPVITIKGYLLSDSMESYPNSYKQKYPSCTDDKLGTKDCPRLFKLQNGYYSDGTK